MKIEPRLIFVCNMNAIKFSVLLVFLTSANCWTKTSAELSEVNFYGFLIREVHTKYHSSGVIVATAPNRLSLRQMTTLAETSRMLSTEGISCNVLHFAEFLSKFGFYMGNGHKIPMVVTILTSIRELQNVESVLKNANVAKVMGLIIFSRTADKDVCNFCRNPLENSLNLKFDAKILISCCDTNIIEEWWSTKKHGALTHDRSPQHHVKSQEVGRLSNDLSVKWIDDLSITNRRYSLDGQKLRIAAVKANRFDLQNDHYHGFFVAILQELTLAMNFTISKIVWSDGYGVYDPATSSWTGVLGSISRREADLGVGEFLMTSDRRTVVDFTAPILFGGFRLHFRKLDSAHLAWNAYFKVFSVNVWIAIIAFILTTPILLTLIEYKNSESNFFSLLSDHYLNVWATYCTQGTAGTPIGGPMRIIHLSLSLSALVILSAYSASMISTIAVSSSYTPFTTIEEFVEDGTYKLIVLRDSIHYDIFKQSNLTLMKRMMSLMQPVDVLPTTYRNGFQQVCSDRVAFFVHKSVKSTVPASANCEILSIRTGNIGSISWIVPQNSELLEPFNHYLQEFRISGMYWRLQERYYKELSDLRKSEHPSVHLQGVAPLISALAIGFFTAVAVCAIERLHWMLMGLRHGERRIRAVDRNLGMSPAYPYSN